ncbi:hypothetical protein Rsub_09069 [Raphidocelis subcapitata]|uniref:3-hydroxybutyryl-CoA dehydrogenase n=1 Tax=Raphidocelis subcapitata TaxID=307507 RepID=A0A2V0P8T7_9CHLO|nr:hypothetical protein Rsub_09069 [Raphidocelis subcapitata]|eukprot:GBF96274.1 hypothetical protein Rsub_09069 [Raphidocelis subcapitata]
MASFMYSHIPQVVGVIGAGQMGSGIAQVLATKGLDVVISDRSTEVLDRGIASIKKQLKRLVRKGEMAEGVASEIVGRVRPETALEAMKDVDFVIEAVTENEEIKKSIFSKLDKIGMHFMNPVPVMQLVEVARGVHTSQQTFESCKGLAEFLGKQVCTSQDRPGFLVNRVLIPMINEAFFCLMEGVGTADDIDKGMRLGTNQPMGPLRLADFIGLDTCLSIMRVLHDGMADSKYRPCPLLQQYVDAGWLGQKVGRGIYQYDNEKQQEAKH